MTIIKRYPNRKLYNTETKKYITLNGISELIRAGDDVQIVDYTTDEDLTAVTLTDSTQFCYDCGNILGWLLKRGASEAEIETTWDRLLTHKK